MMRTSEIPAILYRTVFHVRFGEIVNIPFGSSFQMFTSDDHISSVTASITVYIHDKGSFSETSWPSSPFNLLLLRFWTWLFCFCLRKSIANCTAYWTRGNLFDDFKEIVSLTTLEYGLVSGGVNNKSWFWWHCADISRRKSFCWCCIHSWGTWY